MILDDMLFCSFGIFLRGTCDFAVLGVGSEEIDKDYSFQEFPRGSVDWMF